MAKQPWYSDNEHRDFPFLTRYDPATYVDDTESLSSEGSDAVASPLPQELIVDFGAIMEVDSGYVNAPADYVYLHALRRSGELLHFYFRTTADPADAEECVFVRNLTSANEFDVEWTASLPLSGVIPEPPLGCDFNPRWRAFLVTGTFDDINELLPTDGEIVFTRGLWQVEPARIQTLAHTYVRSFNLANYPRRQVTPPPGCGAAEDQDTTPIVAGRCLTGDISFVEGYNSTIRQEDQTGTLIFGAGVGAGSGRPAAELPLFPDEVSPDAGSLLTGGPTCEQILMSVNGVTGRNLVLTSAHGVLVVAAEDVPNTLVVAKDTADVTACEP